MKTISGIWKVKKEYITDFIELSKIAVLQSRTESGNISFYFSENKTEPYSFLFFEEWKNQEAINFHINQNHFKDFMVKSKPMLTSKPIIKVFDISKKSEL